MRSYSEIETTIKRATKAKGFSWGISEEVGKNIRLLEMFGLPGLKNLNQYYKIYNISNFENIGEISSSNTAKGYYCPILCGLNFYDQSPVILKFNEIEINKIVICNVSIKPFSNHINSLHPSSCVPKVIE